MKRILLTFALACILLPAQAQKKTYDFPFQDPSLPMEERIDDLLSLLTPEEKIGLLMNKSISVDKLGIPSYNWWSEACHGVRADGYTVYPQTIAMGASFDADLVYRIYETVSDEARANWNRSQRAGTIPATRNCPSGARTSTSSATRAGDAARRPRAKTRI